MATITLAANADWSTCNGGSPPAADDTIHLNTYTLTLNAATCTCVLIKACDVGGTLTTGTITPDICTTLNANITAGTVALLTLSSGTVSINGNVTGGSAASAYGLKIEGTAVVTVLSCVGGTNTTAYGIYQTAGTSIIGTSNGSTTHQAKGLVLAGGESTVTSANGAYTNANGVLQSGGTLTIGTATRGSYSSAHGLSRVGGNATVNLAIGGTYLSAAGCYSWSGTTTTTTVGVARGSAIAPGVLFGGGKWVINGVDFSGAADPIGNAGPVWIADGVLLRFKDASGNAKKFYGDSEMPAAGDVRHGTVYGLTDFSGTMPSKRRIGALR